MRKQIYLPENRHKHIQNNNNKTKLLTNSFLYVAEQDAREFSTQDTENVLSSYLQILKWVQWSRSQAWSSSHTDVLARSGLVLNFTENQPDICPINVTR